MSKQPANHCFMPKTNPTAKLRAKKTGRFQILSATGLPRSLPGRFRRFWFGGPWDGRPITRQKPPTESFDWTPSKSTHHWFIVVPFMAPPKKWVSSISFHPRLRSYGPSLKMVMEPSRSQQLKFGHTSLEKETLINSSTYVSSSFHGSKNWVPFKMKVSSAVQICSRGWSQCQGLNVWYTSLLGSFAAYPAYAAPPGATNRCFRHEAKGFQLATKSISTRNQKSNFKKFCSLSLSFSPICTSCETYPSPSPLRNAPHRPAPPVPPVLRLQGSPAMHLPEGALLIPPRQANGITTWSKNQSFGVYPNTCLMFSVHFSSLWWKLFTSPTPLKLCTNQMVESWELAISWSLPSHQYRQPVWGAVSTSSSTIWWSFPSRTGTADITTNPSLQNVPTDSRELPHTGNSVNVEPKGF